MATAAQWANQERWLGPIERRRQEFCWDGAVSGGEYAGGGSFHKPGSLRIDGEICAGEQAAVAFDETVTLTGGFESCAIEAAVAAKNGAKEAVKEEKSDAEVGVHVAMVVHGVMVNVVEAAGLQKPRAKKRVAGHPEIGEVHTVVEVAEHESRPEDEGEQCYGLIKRGYVEQAHGGPENCEDQGRREKPFEADVAERKTGVGGVVVVVVAHGLAGSVNQEVVDEMGAAEEADFVAVQEAVKPVAEEFGEQAREAEGDGDGCGAKQ